MSSFTWFWYSSAKLRPLKRNIAHLWKPRSSTLRIKILCNKKLFLTYRHYFCYARVTRSAGINFSATKPIIVFSIMLTLRILSVIGIERQVPRSSESLSTVMLAVSSVPVLTKLSLISRMKSVADCTASQVPISFQILSLLVMMPQVIKTCDL